MRTKAAVLYEMQKPAPYAVSQPLVIEEIELEGPGSGEVLVEIVGAGLCHSDLSVIDGSRPRVMPMVMGHEASGIVREVGSGVHDLKPDDHVVFAFVPVCGHCLPCATGRPALCENGAKANVSGTLLSGSRRFKNTAGQELNHHLGVSAFSQYTVAAQESLVKIDPTLPLEKTALFGCAVMTGVGAVVNTAKVEPGTSVAVFGLGGVGLSVVMGARAAGAWPIAAVDILENKLKLARHVGASYTVNASTSDAAQAVKDLTNGGAHYVFEAVGNERVLTQAYAATRRGGKTITIGLPHPSKQFTISAVSLVAEERTVMGSYMGSAVPKRDIPRFISLYQAGVLPVDLLHSKTIQLEEINAAFDALARGEAVRQVIRSAML
ncbi:MAG: zinc-dependent alcohol dehydrogenase family protein [candidate division KSB1 bacterium]|nr:zinc-dependent alcohol dehydrogenase family protein [candidate division KSB1 bacterium]MDZ7273321.1 zinc-dependent alcohol dehydrogenase family protein [candidate division KSB1 bacterium]MDZ7285425.1 zinc-dependent alcohol dehydrogenase family protein [candidate division KSB1 bacterium]MDZ7298456.1 zinc-dependent alcohol dehydrogenase family protein [candidate division KSB1 bacterium]MDZ7348911.1 zinc-dependent alcohol dehydrogenase family protein [candidate division KSB1 bacterium]